MVGKEENLQKTNVRVDSLFGKRVKVLACVFQVSDELQERAAAANDQHVDMVQTVLGSSRKEGLRDVPSRIGT